jgi:hypothetical protein
MTRNVSPEYRLYCLDALGRISMAEWIDAENDPDAIQQAQLLKRDAMKCEVWNGSRLVARLDADDLAAFAAEMNAAATRIDAEKDDRRSA